MRHLRYLLGEALTSAADHRAEADEIRQAWYRLASVFDKNIADPRIRTILTKASWSDANFVQQQVGLVRCDRAAAERGVSINYGWAMCREGYDFTSEPVYQYSLLSALLGLWLDAEHEHRRPELFERIVVRQPYSWVINETRAEPIGFNHEETRCGWIVLPFVWDELLQLALEAWLKCLGLDQSGSIVDACTRAAQLDAESIDWTLAHPQWNALICRAVVGQLRPHHALESFLVMHLGDVIPGLRPAVPHQSGALGSELGNMLAYAAKAYTVAHEAAHILHTRQKRAFATPRDGEIAADQDAMAAMWNDELCLGPLVSDGQSHGLLWAAGGLCFYFGLIVLGNLSRSVAVEDSSQTESEGFQRSLTVARLRTWVETMEVLAAEYSERVDGEMAQVMQQVSHLLPSMVAFCNSLLDYAKEVGPPALVEARPIWEQLRPDLEAELQRQLSNC